MNKDTQLIWEARGQDELARIHGPGRDPWQKLQREREKEEKKKRREAKKARPEPKPRGISLPSPSNHDIKTGKDWQFVFNNLFEFMTNNNLTLVDMGDGQPGKLKTFLQYMSIRDPILKYVVKGTPGAKNWIEISSKLLLDSVYTKDISDILPDLAKTQEVMRSQATDEFKEKTGYMQYFNLYSADWHARASRSPRLRSGATVQAAKGGLTNNQLKDIIENAPALGDRQMLSVSDFDQKEIINKLKQVAIIKYGYKPHSPFTRSGNIGRERAGRYRIGLIYATADSPLHDLYDSTVPLELNRNINESLGKIGYKEGEKKGQTVDVRKRSQSLIARAKWENKERYGFLTCEKCKLQPAKDYYHQGQKVSENLADRIIEGHHKKGVQEIEATTADIQCLCNNCHIYETQKRIINI